MLRGKQKSNRLIDMKSIISEVNKLFAKFKSDKASPNWRFTKKLFIEDFLANLTGEDNQLKADNVRFVANKTNEFMEIVSKIENNIFDDEALPLLKLKKDQRDK